MVAPSHSGPSRVTQGLSGKQRRQSPRAGAPARAAKTGCTAGVFGDSAPSLGTRCALSTTQKKTNDTEKTPKPAKTFLGFLGLLLSRQNQPGSTRATFRCPPTHVGKRSESPGKENKERPHPGPEMVPRLTYSSTCFPGLSCFPFTCTFLIKKCHKEFGVDPAMSIIKWN